MAQPVRLAVAGVGNNISALLQGVRYYQERFSRTGENGTPPGVNRCRIGGVPVWGVEFVAAFDVHPDKVGHDVAKAITHAPNNYPRLEVDLPPTGVIVRRGITIADGVTERFDDVVGTLRESGAEVLLYSLPTGRQSLATAYAEAALAAGLSFVNCTPELVARDPGVLARYVAAGLPLIGDDLASHLGASVVHRSLLELLVARGITLRSSYQLNIGGNEDFRNLRQVGASKRQSKLNALSQEGVDVELVEVVPSAGFVGHLEDAKVAFLNIEGSGWADTPVTLDLKLRVQDSSNAAGVIIDLIRIAAVGRRTSQKGFIAAAAPLLKSPADGHGSHTRVAVDASFAQLDEHHP